MGKYILLTNKHEYQTELKKEGLEVLEIYQYYFFNQLTAEYTIAQVHDDTIKITLTEEKGSKTYVNHIPNKFFESFDSIEDAHEELNELTNAKGSKLELVNAPFNFLKSAK